MKRRGELLFTGIFLLIILTIVACDTPTSQTDGAHVHVEKFEHVGDGVLALHFGWDIGEQKRFTFTRSWLAKCDGEVETLESYEVTKDETMPAVNERMQFPQRRRAACTATWLTFDWGTGSVSTDRIDP